MSRKSVGAEGAQSRDGRVVLEGCAAVVGGCAVVEAGAVSGASWVVDKAVDVGRLVATVRETEAGGAAPGLLLEIAEFEQEMSRATIPSEATIGRRATDPGPVDFVNHPPSVNAP